MPQVQFYKSWSDDILKNDFCKFDLELIKSSLNINNDILQAVWFRQYNP